MTDEAKALVAPDMIDLFRIIRRAGRSDRAKAEALAEFMQLIETQAREIERLRGALVMSIAEMMRASGRLQTIAGCNEDRRIAAALSGTCDFARAALAGDSHEQ